jgi:Uri superfamily endonuclease
MGQRTSVITNNTNNNEENDDDDGGGGGVVTNGPYYYHRYQSDDSEYNNGVGDAYNKDAPVLDTIQSGVNNKEKSRIGFIYAIKNDVDDEVYIGSTTKTLDQRFGQHVYDSNHKISTSLHKHMKLIGVSHFKIEVIRRVAFKHISELISLETEYIKRFGTLNTVHNKGFLYESSSDEESPISITLNLIRDVKTMEDVRKLYSDIDLRILKLLEGSDKIVTVDQDMILFVGYRNKLSFLKYLMAMGICYEYKRHGDDAPLLALSKIPSKIITMRKVDYQIVALYKSVRYRQYLLCKEIVAASK